MYAIHLKSVELKGMTVCKRLMFIYYSERAVFPVSDLLQIKIF